MVFTRPPTSKSSSPFSNPLVTIPNAPITIGIIVTWMFHSFFISLARSRYLSFFSLSFRFILWSAGPAKSTIWQILIFCWLLLNLVLIWYNCHCMLYSFFNSLARSKLLSFFSLSFSFISWSAGTAKSTILQVLFFFVDYYKVWSSGWYQVIRVYVKVPEEFMCVIFLDKCWVVHIPFVCMVKF